MKITIQEKAWTISRQVPIAVGARSEGDAPPNPPESGLYFHSDNGDILFFPMPYSQLPSDEQLQSISLDKVHEWIKAARRIR